ncbi:prolipoprotein diacylglyceryl transferase [Mycoplasmopsis mucosicanis]|uniref:Phosphatidylglycerol--prolipoprotein diacylglyceryl transferase n=1 Tax=Mycoplasmopsis mucosicanis TaxID=458208 RepID=A0A507SK30_9BACT|nr:prolipoprotein diacylglyceryl transferase [Mycoplasmopsis mucosicanis]TQC51286.1 prolipoprotein diacylglyceryl transferase [Mycoplasmopsis mucosicanis]
MTGNKYGIVAGIEANSGSVLFNIGSFPVRTYSITLLFGFIAAILTIVFFWRREKYKWEILYGFIILIVPFSIIGARLWDLVEVAIYNPNFDFSSWYKIWEGGLSIQGGVVLGAIVGCLYAYSKRHLIDFRKTIDIIIPTILIGQVIGRWGNYANHEVYGKVDWSGSSVLIFGKNFAQNLFIKDHVSDALNVGGLFRYPLFLYEGLANLFGYLMIVWVFNLFRLFKPGVTCGMYFIWYGLVRFALEPLREESYEIYSVAALAFIVLGTFISLYFAHYSPVHYIKIKQKYGFKWVYAHPQKYLDHINRTRIFASNKPPFTVLNA